MTSSDVADFDLDIRPQPIVIQPRGGLLADICRMCDQRIKEYGFDFSLGHSSARNRDMGALFLILGKYGVHFQNQLKIIFKMVVKFLISDKN